MLKIIDVSSNNGKITLNNIDCDGVITKATGGNSYINPFCDGVVTQAKKAGKVWGFYHFAFEYGKKNTAKSEADYFIKHCKNYFGAGLPVLDYETPINGKYYTDNDIFWIGEFLTHVQTKTKIRPVLYCPKSLANSGNWALISHGVNNYLWFAQYANMNYTGWQSSPWTDGKKISKLIPVMHQFTSTGKIKGFSGDLSIFYKSKADWLQLVKSSKSPVNSPKNLDLLASMVLRGEFSNGERRKEKLYSYVQTQVNNKLAKKAYNTQIEQVLTDILAGKYGNGENRKTMLYNAVQRVVNSSK